MYLEGVLCHSAEAEPKTPTVVFAVLDDDDAMVVYLITMCCVTKCLLCNQPYQSIVMML